MSGECAATVPDSGRGMPEGPLDAEVAELILAKGRRFRCSPATQSFQQLEEALGGRFPPLAGKLVFGPALDAQRQVAARPRKGVWCAECEVAARKPSALHECEDCGERQVGRRCQRCGLPGLPVSEATGCGECGGSLQGVRVVMDVYGFAHLPRDVGSEGLLEFELAPTWLQEVDGSRYVPSQDQERSVVVLAGDM